MPRRQVIIWTLNQLETAERIEYSRSEYPQLTLFSASGVYTKLPKRSMNQNGPREGQKRPTARSKTANVDVQNGPLVCQKRPIDQNQNGPDQNGP